MNIEIPGEKTDTFYFRNLFLTPGEFYNRYGFNTLLQMCNGVGDFFSINPWLDTSTYNPMEKRNEGFTYDSRNDSMFRFLIIKDDVHTDVINRTDRRIHMEVIFLNCISPYYIDSRDIHFLFPGYIPDQYRDPSIIIHKDDRRYKGGMLMASYELVRIPPADRYKGKDVLVGVSINDLHIRTRVRYE